MSQIDSSTYLNDFNVKVLLVLLSLSVAAIVIHRLGFLDITLDLQSPDTYSYVAPVLDGNVEGELKNTDGKYSSSCNVLSLEGYTSCGISIGIGPEITDGDHDISKGVDLSSYDRVEIQINHTTPNPNDRLKLSFRHYDPQLSNKEEFVSLKYNSLIYRADSAPGKIVVPLRSFKVDDWWLRRFNVDYENAGLDYTNVVFVEVVSANVEMEGQYAYYIDSIILYGQVISELELIKLLAVIWLIAVILLAFRQVKQLDTISKTDMLTKLLNRRGIEEAVNLKLEDTKSRNSYYLFYFDINGFKKINDTHGHYMGDKLLVEVGERISRILSELTKKPGLIARLGGDEFVVSLSHCNESLARQVSAKIVSELSAPMSIDGRLMKVGLSIGIVGYDQRPKDFNDLLDMADTAMYVAKRESGNGYRIFNSDVKALIYKRRKIAEDLKESLANNLFELYFMPLVDAKTGVTKRLEILLRTSNPELVGIGPDEFIPVAEEFGLIHKIDLWVLENTFQTIQKVESDPTFKNITFCINISSKEINNASFTSDLSNLFSKYAISPQLVELEITETSLVEIDDNTISVLNELRGLGVSLALDDFGTGYSSFHHMVKYPIDCIKIDKSFLDNFEQLNEAHKTIIRSILSIASAHNLTTVAEGVETDMQRVFLRQSGCDLLQGYLIAKPLSWADINEFLSMSLHKAEISQPS